MIKAWEHFKTITHHKRLVMEGCFKVGLYRQGILHDMSKFSPSEFLVGARYWQGNRSPNNAEREAIGYSSSWLHQSSQTPPPLHPKTKKMLEFLLHMLADRGEEETFRYIRTRILK